MKRTLLVILCACFVSQLAFAGVVAKINIPGSSLWEYFVGGYDSGDSISIESAGSWSHGLAEWCGPEGLPPRTGFNHIIDDAPAYALLGKFGQNGTPFVIGSSWSGTAPSNEPLYFAMNDFAGAFEDNAGSVDMTLETSSVPEPTSLVLLGLGGLFFRRKPRE